MMREKIYLTTNEDFRKDWNVLEYKVEVIRSETNPETAPIFFEYNLIYDFTNRIDVLEEFTPYQS
jgi:hypothetical protein